METKNYDDPALNKFDLCFYGLNLTGAILALAALRSGLKVCIVMEQPLQWDFNPEMVNFYPMKFNKVFRTGISIKYFCKISSLFPSLVYQQRVITVLEGKKFQSKKVNLIDFFLKHERDIASLPINFTHYLSFQILRNHFRNGLLVQEFRFDRNMANIELLRRCRSLGACIVSDSSAIQQLVKGNCIFKCLPFQDKACELKIENFRFDFNNNIRIVTRYFEITSQVQSSDTLFHFQSKRKMKLNDFISHIFIILRSFEIESPESFQDDIISIYNNLENKDKQIQQQRLSETDIFNFKKNYLKAGKEISKIIGKSIRLRENLSGLKYSRLDEYNFRKLQAECDDKFDMAKQTEIEYERFCYYFYRYYLSIDDLIELAYQKMINNRTDLKRVWEEVETEFREKIEAEIFS